MANPKFNFARFLLVATLFVAPLLLSAANAENLPELNDSASQTLNEQDELILGKQLMANARARLNLLDDPLLESYVQLLTMQLGIHSSRKLLDLQTSIALNPVINAFAVPGGQIAINTGLITAAQSEGELASVIAHEISHHSQRHIPRMLENSKKASLPSAAALLGGLLIGGQAGIATIAAVRGALISNQLAYSRGYEQEADAAGMKLLAKAGYNPTHMPTFFGRLEKQSQIQGGEGPEFLRTHPLSGNRIAEAHSRVKSLKLVVEERIELNTLLDFELAQSRTVALYGEPLEKIISSFKADLAQASGPQGFADAYGLALAYMRSGDLKRAAQSIEVKSERHNDLAMLTQAEIALQANNKIKALGLLDNLIIKHPNNLTIGLTRARVLKRMDRLNEASQQARKMMRGYPGHSQTHLLLADIAGAKGDFAQAGFHKSEFYYHLGDYKKAARALAPYSVPNAEAISSYLASRIKDLQRKIDEAEADVQAMALKL